MKKLFFTAVLMAMTVICFAQSKNIVPEYVGQVAILNPDSTLTVVTKEAGSIKTKSSKWGMIPIPGSGPASTLFVVTYWPSTVGYG